MSSRFGTSTEKIDALSDYAKSPLFNDAEKVALEYAVAITDTWHKVAALQPAARGKRREVGSQLRGQP